MVQASPRFRWANSCRATAHQSGPRGNRPAGSTTRGRPLNAHTSGLVAAGLLTSGGAGVSPNAAASRSNASRRSGSATAGHRPKRACPAPIDRASRSNRPPPATIQASVTARGSSQAGFRIWSNGPAGPAGRSPATRNTAAGSGPMNSPQPSP